MLLCTVILLGSVHPVLLLKMKDRDLMEGTLQKFVEDFMAYYGNNTGFRHSKPPQRIRTVFGMNRGNRNQIYVKGEKAEQSYNYSNRNQKKLFKNRQKKRKLQKIEGKPRTKSQIKGHAQTQPHGDAYIQPHGHAYEFDGAFDPFPLWEYSGR